MKRAANPTEAARKLNQGIRWELRRYPADKVAAFVRTVGAALGSADIWREHADEAKRLRDLARLESATERYIAELGRPVLAHEFPRRMHGAVLADDRDRKQAERFYRARQAALEAALTMQHEARTALQIAKPRRRGRPAADDLGLLARLAARYLALFGERPTSTPGGTFVNVATLALENLHGRAPRDVSRQVRAALKTI